MPIEAQSPYDHDWSPGSVAHAFSAKLNLTLKALSINRSRLATELGVDKSIVGRWARGAVKPSSENLARLTGFIAGRVPSFTALDWERDMADLASVLGVDRDVAGAVVADRLGSRFHDNLIEEATKTTVRRGDAFEGVIRFGEIEPLPENRVGFECGEALDQ